MIRLILLAMLFAAPLSAAHESNFGRVILSKSDLIVHGVASAERTRVGGAFRVEVVVQDVIYGETERDDLSVFYSNRELIEDGAVEGLFALANVGEGGGKLVGKPVVIKEGDPEKDLKIRVARDFVKLEGKAEGDERTADFWRLLVEHIRHGGYAAQNAAIELMFVARDRGSIITEERFDDVIAARDDVAMGLPKDAKSDLKLALQGLVEARVKRLKFMRVRRGDNEEERREAADELLALMGDYPRAFLERDAGLCDALKGATDDRVLKLKLDDLASDIREAVRAREAEENEDAARKRRRIEHAKSG